MRFLLGCLGVAFVVFGGCVLAAFGIEGAAGDDFAFVIGAAIIFLFGSWALYKAVTMRPAAPVDNGSGPSD